MSKSQIHTIGVPSIEANSMFGVSSVTIMNIGQQFEWQVKEIFAKVLSPNTIEDSVNFFDFAFAYQEKHYAVEVKYYRTKAAQMHLIMRAAEMLQVYAQRYNYQPVLVIGAVLHQQQRNLIKERFPTLILVDRKNLLNTAYHHDLINNLTPFFGMTEWDNYADAKDLLTLLKDANNDQ